MRAAVAHEPARASPSRAATMAARCSARSDTSLTLAAISALLCMHRCNKEQISCRKKCMHGQQWAMCSAPHLRLLIGVLTDAAFQVFLGRWVHAQSLRAVRMQQVESHSSYRHELQRRRATTCIGKTLWFAPLTCSCCSTFRSTCVSRLPRHKFSESSPMGLHHAVKSSMHPVI